MGGGWFGYVYTILGCGAAFFLIAGTTGVLYAWARVQRRRGQEVRARVRTLPASDEPPTS